MTTHIHITERPRLRGAMPCGRQTRAQIQAEVHAHGLSHLPPLLHVLLWELGVPSAQEGAGKEQGSARQRNIERKCVLKSARASMPKRARSTKGKLRTWRDLRKSMKTFLPCMKTYLSRSNFRKLRVNKFRISQIGLARCLYEDCARAARAERRRCVCVCVWGDDGGTTMPESIRAARWFLRAIP